MTDNRFEVRRLPAELRYALFDRGEDGTLDKEIGEESYLDIERDGRRERIFHHTLVSEAYGGQGLASKLVDAAVSHAIDEGHAVVPVCPYVAKWIPRHPEYAEHVVQPTPEHLQALRDAR